MLDEAGAFPSAAELPDALGVGEVAGGAEVAGWVGVGEVAGADVSGLAEDGRGEEVRVGVEDVADADGRRVGSAVRVGDGEELGFGVGEGVIVCCGTTTTGAAVFWSGRTNR
ncbi:hypothetical protein P5P86_06020 [Nocardioides sp. BP30]|uniref:hypothetical protein n=1 Tax=Nocardioides sp. BP30 TaxID=3036374 RepID=UPI002468690E|nr:hypothetical protein [Nocardioides sp. BP30]WGL53382.1 hypothetical protein P5P86_06020 [Nocardioides sp. BP30]